MARRALARVLGVEVVEVVAVAVVEGREAESRDGDLMSGGGGGALDPASGSEDERDPSSPQPKVRRSEPVCRIESIRWGRLWAGRRRGGRVFARVTQVSSVRLFTGNVRKV